MKKRSKRILFLFADALFVFVLFTLPDLLSHTPLDFGFKKCFLTPDLFSRSGTDFLSGFLFELPAAAARWTSNAGMIPLVCLFVILAVIQIFTMNKADCKK
ncbi:MAG: hypothetical protein KBA55_00290 [Ruminococcus sp.]|nr:hypothetical protein [Ruminococcus sp.]